MRRQRDCYPDTIYEPYGAPRSPPEADSLAMTPYVGMTGIVSDFVLWVSDLFSRSGILVNSIKSKI